VAKVWRLWWTERLGHRSCPYVGRWPLYQAVPTDVTHEAESIQEAKQWMVSNFLGTALIGGFTVVLDTVASLTEVLVYNDVDVQCRAHRILTEILGRERASRTN